MVIVALKYFEEVKDWRAVGNAPAIQGVGFVGRVDWIEMPLLIAGAGQMAVLR